jgi:hypothetical protein
MGWVADVSPIDFRQIRDLFPLQNVQNAAGRIQPASQSVPAEL